jgi:hypothetical protein
MAPPPNPAVFPTNVLLLIETGPSPLMAPPLSAAELPEKILFTMPIEP